MYICMHVFFHYIIIKMEIYLNLWAFLLIEFILADTVPKKQQYLSLNAAV